MLTNNFVTSINTLDIRDIFKKIYEAIPVQLFLQEIMLQNFIKLMQIFRGSSLIKAMNIYISISSFKTT